MEAKWNPNLTFVVRVREVGTDKWSFGFETPLTCCTLVDLKPDTEYEMQVRGKNALAKARRPISRRVLIRKETVGTSLHFRRGKGVAHKRNGLVPIGEVVPGLDDVAVPALLSLPIGAEGFRVLV